MKTREFYCTITNKLFVKSFILAIPLSISINGCTYTNGVSSMEDEENKNKTGCTDPSSISQEALELLIDYGFSLKEIQDILPGDLHQDKLNEAFVRIKFREEDKLNPANASSLLLRSFETLSSIDHFVCINQVDSSKFEENIKILTNIILATCGKGFNINQPHQGYDESNGRLIFEPECGNTMLMSAISSGRDNSPMPALLLLSDKANVNPFIPDF